MDSIKIKLNTGDDFIIKKLKKSIHFTNIHRSVKHYVLLVYVSVVKTLIKSKERIYKSGKYPIHSTNDFLFPNARHCGLNFGGKYNRIGVIFLINLWINIICKMT